MLGKELSEARARAESMQQDLDALTSVLEALAMTTTADEAIGSPSTESARRSAGRTGRTGRSIRPRAELRFSQESGHAGPDFEAVTRAASFREGVGLSGRAWKTRDLFFVSDLGTMTDCVRAPVAQKAGVKSGVCFPWWSAARSSGPWTSSPPRRSYPPSSA